MIFTVLLIVLLHSSKLVASPLQRSLIQRRQLLDGTAKSDGVAPKQPGISSSTNSDLKTSISFVFSTSQTMLTTTKGTTTALTMLNEKIDERSMKETSNSNSKSKAGLITAIAAPTGLLGIVGTVIGAFLYKKNQSNSSSNSNSRGFLNQILNFTGNSIL